MNTTQYVFGRNMRSMHKKYLNLMSNYVCIFNILLLNQIETYTSILSTTVATTITNKSNSNKTIMIITASENGPLLSHFPRGLPTDSLRLSTITLN